MDYDVQKAINQAESIATNPPVIPKSQMRMKDLGMNRVTKLSL